MTTEQYNKIVIGFVVQSYRDGECVRQDFIASDEVSREDPATGESIEVDVKAKQHQSMEMVQPVSAADAREVASADCQAIRVRNTRKRSTSTSCSTGLRS